jgi:uncharacterized membrane protein
VFPVAATLYEWLLFLHILAGMVWVGGTVALAALATYILRSADADGITRFIGSLRVVGPIVLAPAPVLLVAMGIWLVLDTDAWDFGQGWVQLGLGLFVAAFLYGAAFQSRAAIAARRAVDSGDHERAVAYFRRWSVGAWVILVVLVLAVADMVFKPGL